MNLNTLTSGLITSKFGVRPALMCAAKKDLSKHSVVRIVSEEASGWIGITYGQLITGAKCQTANATLSGNEALAAMLKLQKGVFDLIQIDSRLLGEELAHSIGIRIEDLLEAINKEPELLPLEVIRKCKKADDAITLLAANDKIRKQKRTGELNLRRTGEQSKLSAEHGKLTDEQIRLSVEQSILEDDGFGPDDEEWDLGDEGVIEALERQARGEPPLANLETLLSLDSPDPVLESKESQSPSEELQTSSAVADWSAAEPNTSSYELGSATESGEYDGLPSTSEMDRAFPEVKRKTSEISQLANRFVIVSQETENSLVEETEAKPQRKMLREDLRAELHEFVRNKFGVEGRRFFEDVDISESGNYQESIVLRDLEKALRGGDELEARQAPNVAIASSPELDDDLDQSSSAKLAKAPWVKSQTTSGVMPELKPKFKSQSLPVIESETRNIFTEKMRKDSEVDRKTFTGGQDKETDLELKFLKEKKNRQTLIIVALSCVFVSAIALIVFVSSRQSSLDAANQQLIGGDLPAAKLSFEKIMKSQPENWEAFLGHASTVPTDYAAQVKDYEQVLKIKPDETNAALGLTKAYFELKDYPKAIDAADLGYKLDTHNLQSLSLKGQSLMKIGKYADASEVFKLALATPSNNNAELNYLLASCYGELGKSKEQAEYIRKSLAIDPRNAHYLNELGLILFKNKNFNEASATLEKAISINPGDAELHYNLAKVFMQQQYTDKAIDELSKAIDRGMANAETLGQRGSLYYFKHQYGPAKADLDGAVEISPADKSLLKTQALNEAALAAAKSRVGTRQIADAPDDVPLNPQELQGDYVGRAYQLMAQGKSVTAAKILRYAVRQNPNDVRARRYLANALYNSGDIGESLTQYGLVAGSGTLSPEELFIYGKALVKANRFEQAIKILHVVVEQQPSFSKARVQLIKAYSEAGFNDHAREECQKGMQQAANPSEYAEYKSLMP